MRIAIASQTYYPGNNGQAVFTISLAEGLAGLGHQVMVIVPATPFLAKATVINGVQVQTVAAIPLAALHPNVHFTPLPGLKIWQLLADFHPDLVHIQDHYPLCHSVLRTARLRKLPLIGTNHFLPDNLIRNLAFMASKPEYFKHFLWRWMLDVFNQLDMVVTPTRTAAQILLRQHIRVPIVPISCGVNTRRFRPLPATDRSEVRRRYGLDPARALLMYVGRLDQEKQLDVLLRTMGKLKDTTGQLALIGRGNHGEALRGLAVELGLGSRVVFTGYAPANDLPALLNSADIFAMPSTAELQSIATLEAMATAKPVLAADAQALPELVTNGLNGYLFKPDDADHAAGRVSQLLAERDHWAAMGQVSLDRARQHSLGNTLRRHEELYAALIRIKRPVRHLPLRTELARRLHLKPDLSTPKQHLLPLIKFDRGRHERHPDREGDRY